MKTEVQIRTTQPCPECNGEGEITNPEWIAFSAKKKEWEQGNGYTQLDRFRSGFDYDAHRKAETEWENSYWREQGYTTMDGPFVGTPWDVTSCHNCGGSGTEVQYTWVEYHPQLPR